MSEGPEWFAPKRYGLGTGLPIRWQGWALLIGFGAAVLAAAIVVAVIYGLGFLFAGLLVFIPLAILISLVPALAPFAVVGFAIYWFWWRKRSKPGVIDAAGK